MVHLLHRLHGVDAPGVDKIRYLGVHFVRRSDYAKRSFHRAANSIFGKIRRIISDESAAYSSSLKENAYGFPYMV